MLGVASGAILVPLNSTMLAVALPDVMGDFGLGANAVSSLVTLYLGAVAVTLPIGGSLGDRYGHRPTFLAGVAGFAVASAVAAIATSFEILELSRVGQAASGALISTSSAALVRETTPPERQGEAFGVFDLLVSTSAAVGPFIGGLLVGGFGWRSLFVLAVPLGIISAAFVGLALRPTPAAREATREQRARAAPIDVPGLVLLALAIIAFLIALRSEGGRGIDGPTSSPVRLLAALAVVPLLGLFVLVELRRERPAVDPRLFLRRQFAAAVLGVFGATVILHGAFILVPLLTEILLGESPATSGAVLLGIAGVGAIVAPLGGRASDRHGRRVLAVAGGLITAAGLAALALPAGASSALIVAALLCVVGLGLGISGSPRQAAAFESIEPSRVGMAAGTYYTGRYLGGVVGASLAGAILGAEVTPGGVSAGFAVLAVVGVGVALVSLGLSGRGRRPERAGEHAAAGAGEAA
jgi:EmrB/QacA subfamily drug resistance transporter